MTILLAVVCVLTVHRLTRLVVADTFPPIKHLRDRILSRWPSEDTIFGEDAITSTSGEGQDDVVTTQAGVIVDWEPEIGWYAREPHWFGDLITCPWCTSVWVAALTVPVFWLFPDVMLWVGLVPAASSITALLGGHD